MAILNRTLAAGAVAAMTIGTVGAVAAPASAGGRHHDGGGLSLTRGAAQTLDRYNVDVDWTKATRTAHRGGSLRGTLVFDGDATTTWSKIRVNDRTNRVTAVVNGDERRPVLRFRDVGRSGGWDCRFGHSGRGGTVLRLTKAGAASIDRAAGADAFDAGDAFAKAGRHHRHH